MRPAQQAIAGFVCRGVIVLFFLSAMIASAGDWHSGSDLACSDCHTMHNSSGGQPMRYDGDPSPAQHLLRDATSLTLCIYCHDGSTPNAPDVVAPVNGALELPGGFFPTAWSTPSGTAHALGGSNPETPPGGSRPMVLTCTSCHDPHGGPSYRNLRLDPAGTGASLPVSATEVVRANGSNPSRVYASSNITYKGGISSWCGACHGDYHGRPANEEGTSSPWLRHPQDQTIARSRNADFDFWRGAVPGRVPVQSPDGEAAPSPGDQVFCLSCHKAHGSANRAATIFADGKTLTSTCQQCHDK